MSYISFSLAGGDALDVDITHPRLVTRLGNV